MIAMDLVLSADGMAKHAFVTKSTDILRKPTGLMNIAQDILMAMRVGTIVI